MTVKPQPIFTPKKRLRNFKLWVVTYDLPKGAEYNHTLGKLVYDPVYGPLRRRFYRKLKKYLTEHPDTKTVWMAMSTLITASKEFSDFVLREVARIPTAKGSVYSARLEKLCGTPPQFKPQTPKQGEFMADVIGGKD